MSEEMPFPRKLLPALRAQVGKKTIVVLTGMRQVGKTTLMRMLYNEIKSENKAFLDMENPIIRRAFDERDYDSIWENLRQYGVKKPAKAPAYVFLDELQSAPEAVRAIKYLFDHYNVQFFVTGSASFYLKGLFPESLAGRKVLFELYPLDFEEYLLFKGREKEFKKGFAEKQRAKNEVAFAKDIKHYEAYLDYGGFPKVVLAEGVQEKKQALDDIFTSYFEKDVKSLSDFKDSRRLQDFIILLLQRTGSRLNLSRISAETGINRETLYSYLAFLEATYFVHLVPPYSKSPDREVSGAKKVYACDTGILNRFAQVSSGAVLENSIFLSLAGRGGVKYYQRRSGQEIDFVLPEEGVALEVKETGTMADVQKLSHIAHKIGMKESYVVSKSFVPQNGFIMATYL
jgi:predicted AAA+ superfamily ATPase